MHHSCATIAALLVVTTNWH